MEYVYFSLDNVKLIGWVCLAVAFVCVVWLLWPYRRRVLLPVRVARAEVKGRKAEAEKSEGDSEALQMPDVSVIIYGTGNVEGLENLLGQIAAQRYTGKVETVVVNDGNCEDMSDAVTRFSLLHPEREVYYTFVPDGARNLSRKKLCLSLGVKAARHEIVVLTTCDCIICSDRWLERMTAPMMRGKEVVLGVASMKGLKGAMNRFDEVATIATWLTSALSGHPYRGTGYNLAYRRRLFFDNKGFAGSLTLHFGDDDIFVNRIATADNTAVALGRDALVRVTSPVPSVTYREQRLRHCYTGRKLRGALRSRLMFAISVAAMWLWLAATAGCIVMTLPNALPGCVALALLPILWIPLVVAWKRLGRLMGVSLPAAILPFDMLFHWVRLLVWGIRSGLPSRKNHTWRN